LIVQNQQKDFRKEDFRVQVDGAGRLTVRGQRAADGNNKHVRFHKVFQLPPASNLEGISGRFDAGVLSLTVPKRPAAEGLTSNNQPPTAAKEEGKEDMDKQKEEDVNKAETKRPQQEEAKKAEDKEEEIKKPQQVDAKAEQAPPALTRSKEEDKPKSPQTKQQPDKEEESLLEKKKEEAEREGKQQQISRSSAGGGWKERVAEELQGLASSEWAEGVAETVKKNKEVIAVAVAAFSLGLFVSTKLCSRNN
jgi:hypothetical protein